MDTIYILSIRTDTPREAFSEELSAYRHPEDAKTAMEESFRAAKEENEWPDETDEGRKFYIMSTDDCISVKDGDDSFEWSVEAVEVR